MARTSRHMLSLKSSKVLRPIDVLFLLDIPKDSSLELLGQVILVAR